MNGNFDMFILILYAALILFFVYRIFKGQKSKGLLEGEVSEFSRKISPFEIALFTILLFTGVLNFYNGYKNNNQTVMMTAAVMALLAVVFIFASRNKLYIAPNGMLANSNFYTYKELKKWGFDPERGDLVLLVKKDKQESNEVVKVNPNDIDPINKLIRRYKLNK